MGKCPLNLGFGVATAAYQIEGAHNEGARGSSIWDDFSHTANKVSNGDTGDTAVGFYGRYLDDIRLMKSLGVTRFRMSISWPRIQPLGTGAPNAEGVAFYNRVIDALLEAGIEPWLTLYHWDLPSVLHEQYLGWLSARVVDDFAAYAEVCYRAFGDRVRNWVTFNEPWTFCTLGYGSGVHAPGRGSDRTRCLEGNSDTEPWLASHHVLLAHAEAVKRFRRLVPGGAVGMALNSDWAEPFSDGPADQAAAERHMEFMCCLYADPLYFGEYPASVRQRVTALPAFTAEQQAALKGSVDFFALNHYSTKWFADAASCSTQGGGLWAAEGTREFWERDGSLIGPQADSPWLYVVPWGFRKLLRWIHERYGGPDICVTENGVSAPNESSIPLPEVLDDEFRVEYYKTYLAEAEAACREDGVNLKAYFAWSLLDNFEWADGYDKRFGIVYVDYKTLQRYPKASAKWLAQYFSSNTSPTS